LIGDGHRAFKKEFSKHPVQVLCRGVILDYNIKLLIGINKINANKVFFDSDPCFRLLKVARGFNDLGMAKELQYYWQKECTTGRDLKSCAFGQISLNEYCKDGQHEH